MSTNVPKGFEDISKKMKESNGRVLNHLLNSGYKIEDYPSVPELDKLEGEGAAIAYPIQGILKYHGLSDWNSRIAYLPSISLNNDAAKSVTYVRFDPSFQRDIVFINDKEAQGRDLERVQQTLDFIRDETKTSTKALVVSKNIVRASKTGKGLGTSASASAALAMAAIEASLGREYSSNNRYLTTVARYLAGSGCRSAAGGISLWLSYPGIDHKDSFAVRLDSKNEFDDLSLITIPIDSKIGLKTEDAHKDAPNSYLFKAWMLDREERLFEFFNAVESKNWQKIGDMAEKDTFLLHGITSSAGDDYKIIAMEPETISILRSLNDLRKKGILVYGSVDTGPTPVLITHKSYEKEVVKHLASIGFEKDVIVGKITGPSEIISKKQAEELLGSLDKYS